MTAFHNGQLRTMSACYVEKTGEIRVIRPLAYVRESVLRKWSLQAQLPVINENCPACFEAPKERRRVKKMLQQEESIFGSLFGNLRKALVPLMDASIAGDLATNQRQREQQLLDDGGEGAVVKLGYRNFRQRHKGSSGQGHRVSTAAKRREWELKKRRLGLAPAAAPDAAAPVQAPPAAAAQHATASQRQPKQPRSLSQPAASGETEAKSAAHDDDTTPTRRAGSSPAKGPAATRTARLEADVRMWRSLAVAATATALACVVGTGVAFGMRKRP